MPLLPLTSQHNSHMADAPLVPSPEVLQFLLSDGSGGFTPFRRALDGLSGDQAVLKPAGSPHSVADILAHMVFWQERFLAMVDGAAPRPVPHAADGWPEVGADEWPRLVERYLAGLERYKELAADPAALARPLVEGRERTVGASVLSYYVHEAHHLGQLILVRRLIGAWPPPG